MKPPFLLFAKEILYFKEYKNIFIHKKIDKEYKIEVDSFLSIQSCYELKK